MLTLEATAVAAQTLLSTQDLDCGRDNVTGRHDKGLLDDMLVGVDVFLFEGADELMVGVESNGRDLSLVDAERPSRTEWTSAGSVAEKRRV